MFLKFADCKYVTVDNTTNDGSTKQITLQITAQPSLLLSLTHNHPLFILPSWVISTLQYQNHQFVQNKCVNFIQDNISTSPTIVQLTIHQNQRLTHWNQNINSDFKTPLSWENGCPPGLSLKSLQISAQSQLRNVLLHTNDTVMIRVLEHNLVKFIITF